MTLKQYLFSKTKGCFISTGSTLLNLALTDCHTCGIMLKRIVNIIGESSSGKTFLAMTILAMAHFHPRFRKHKKVFDDAEAANSFDMRYLFGEAADAIVPPEYDETGEEMASETIQDFEMHINKLLKAGKPFIYVLDSFDALTSNEEIKHADKSMKAQEQGKDAPGTYGMEKAKFASTFLRKIRKKLKQNDSVLIVLSQTRENTGRGYSTSKRSGGRALKFYSTHECWLTIVEKFKKSNKEVGVRSRVKCTKNKVTGKRRDADIFIYYDYGIDDVTANVDYLVTEKVWKKKKNSIETPWVTATLPKVIKYIEENGKEERVAQLVADHWHRDEDKLKVTDRKRKFKS
jgi:RecA/RadA recombinase